MLKKQGTEITEMKYHMMTSLDGIHFNDVDMVVQIKLPEEANDYLHRAGRTGRNGSKGTCISIVTENEVPHLMKFAAKLGFKPVEIFLRNGKIMMKKKVKENITVD